MNNIEQKRLENAIISQGISTNAILEMVKEIIAENDLKGDVLDFGAGIGNLSRILHSLDCFNTINSVDILDRPNNLTEEVIWHKQDLNNEFKSDKKFDLIVCVEVIEHLENPRATFRNFQKLLKPKGKLLLTTPNQHSLRSKLCYFFGGHFAGFIGTSYPAHITALLKLDLQRICEEVGFSHPIFYYSNEGGVPKKPSLKWQEILKVLKGNLFSDNLAIFTNLK